MRMLKTRSRLDLDNEPLGTKNRGELRLEDLECNLAIVLEVLSEIDGGHTTLAQLPIDAVPVR